MSKVSRRKKANFGEKEMLELVQKTQHALQNDEMNSWYQLEEDICGSLTLWSPFWRHSQELTLKTQYTLE